MGYTSGSVEKAFEKFSKEVRSNIGGREVVYMIVLMAFLIFLSLTVLPAQISGADITNSNGYKEWFVIFGYGKPFEMLRIWFPLEDFSLGPRAVDQGGLMVSLENQARGPGTPNVLWAGLVADLAIFLLSAFIIIFAITKLKNDREYSRYYG